MADQHIAILDCQGAKQAALSIYIISQNVKCVKFPGQRGVQGTVCRPGKGCAAGYQTGRGPLFSQRSVPGCDLQWTGTKMPERTPVLCSACLSDGGEWVYGLGDCSLLTW